MDSFISDMLSGDGEVGRTLAEEYVDMVGEMLEVAANYLIGSI